METEEVTRPRGYEFVPRHLHPKVWVEHVAKIDPKTLRTINMWCLHITEGFTLCIEAAEHVLWYIRVVYLLAIVLLALALFIWREV